MKYDYGDSFCQTSEWVVVEFYFNTFCSVRNMEKNKSYCYIVFLKRYCISDILLLFDCKKPRGDLSRLDNATRSIMPANYYIRKQNIFLGTKLSLYQNQKFSFA